MYTRIFSKIESPSVHKSAQAEIMTHLPPIYIQSGARKLRIPIYMKNVFVDYALHKKAINFWNVGTCQPSLTISVSFRNFFIPFIIHQMI